LLKILDDFLKYWSSFRFRLRVTDLCTLYEGQVFGASPWN